MKTNVKNVDSLNFNPYQLAKLEDILTNGKIFNDSDKFKDREFCDKLMNYNGPEVDTQWFFNHMNSLDGLNTGEHSKSVTLTANQESLLFLKYNYIKKTINSIASLNVYESYDRLLELEEVMLSVREQLVGANLGLVLNIARTSNFACVDFSEALGEGHMALLDAIEKFDTAKGKFSTYFTRIFINALIKVNNLNMKNSSNAVSYDPALHDAPEVNYENIEALDLINEFLSGTYSDVLDEDELFVLQKKYVDGLTLEEIGQTYDPVKTKGQVFYVEKKARLKIKDALTDLL